MLQNKINRTPFEWLNEDSVGFLSKGYLEKDEDPKFRIKSMGESSQKILIDDFKKNNPNKEVPEKLKNFAETFYEYMSYGWFSLSSPLWANFGRHRGLPISCFNSHYSDNMGDILFANAEVGIMTKMGGGTSGYFGDIRHRGAPITTGGVSEGAVHFMSLTEKNADSCKQAGVRRGAFAAYLPIDHDDFEEFIRIRQEGSKLQDIFFGVTISDCFIERMNGGDVDAQDRWCKVLEARNKTGMPYIFFEGNVDKGKPQIYKDNGIDIKSSNLCSEILLESNKEESFVCCLSSMNLLHFDEWKDTDAVMILSLLLDSVLTEFIDKTDGMMFMDRPRKFAKNQRALGLGVLGWHSLLQSRGLAFGEFASNMLNSQVFKLIDDQTLESTKQMATWFGEPDIIKGSGQRNVTRTAIAPTMSSSFILGQVSSGIEPFHSNGSIQDLAKGKHEFKNPFLIELLKKKGENTKEVWDKIFLADGSVQHLDFLTKKEKDIYLTFFEISQGDIISQAAARQKYICQSQSLNIAIDPRHHTPKQVSDLILRAHKLGVKTLYYQRNVNAARKAAADKRKVKLRAVFYEDTKLSSLLSIFSTSLGKRFRKTKVRITSHEESIENFDFKPKDLDDCSSCQG